MIKIIRRPDVVDMSIVEYDITLERVNKTLELASTDPFGFYKFKMTKGKLPELLQGIFTTFEQARKALISYEAVAEKDKEIIEPKTSSIPK